MWNRKNSNEERYLTFALGREEYGTGILEYGIGILKVRDIISMTPIIPVLRVSKIKGVIKLGERTIPVVDLRSRCENGCGKHSESNRIIVAEIGTDGEEDFMGVIVDTVSEVVNLRLSNMEESSFWRVRLATDYFLGIANEKNGVRGLLNVERALAFHELKHLNVPGGFGIPNATENPSGEVG